MKRSWSLSLIVIGAAVLVLWLAIRSTPNLPPAADVAAGSGEPESRGGTLEREAGTRARTAESAGITESDPVLSDSRLRVHSEAGLPLESVEVEGEPGRWRKVLLEDGSCD